MADVIDLFQRSVAKSEPLEYHAFHLSEAREQQLFISFRNEDYLILYYADLDSICNVPGSDPNKVALLHFRGCIKREIRIEGERLLDIIRHLRWQRIDWVKEMPEQWNGPRDGSVPYISTIAVTEFASAN
jgi:hypothetical protein